jgi:hypothetical protein
MSNMPSIQNSDKSESITLRCSADLKRAVRIAAAEQDTTIEDLCADLITRGLNVDRPLKKKTA